MNARTGEGFSMSAAARWTQGTGRLQGFETGGLESLSAPNVGGPCGGAVFLPNLGTAGY